MHHSRRLIFMADTTNRQTEVTVNFGPFKGYKGIVLPAASPKRVVVKIALKHRHVLLELDEDMVDGGKRNGA
jgi:hypothetical protein